MRHHETDQRTIGHVLADKAAVLGGRRFLRLPGRTGSYAELDGMTSRYANGFAALGIGRGDHVAMLMPNCASFCSRCGAWASWARTPLGSPAARRHRRAARDGRPGAGAAGMTAGQQA